LLLTADVFPAALGVVPAEDWCRTWAADRTIMLRRTSKRVKEAVDKMRLPSLITTLELPRCEMTGQDAERLARALVQCPALAHLILEAILASYQAGQRDLQECSGSAGSLCISISMAMT
jgi:hypothetical protein